MPEPPAVANSNADGRLLVLVGREAELHGDVVSLVEWLATHGWIIDAAVPEGAPPLSGLPRVHAIALPWSQATRSAAARNTLRSSLRALTAHGSYDAVLCTDPVSGLIGRWSLPRRARGGARMIAVSSTLNAIARARGVRRLLLLTGERILNSRTDSMIVHSQEELGAAVRLCRLSRCRPVLLPCLGVAEKPAPSPARVASLRALFEVQPGELMVYVPHTFDDSRTERVILDAATSVREFGVEAKFVVEGSGPNESRMRQSVRDEGLGTVVAFAGERPHDSDLALSCDLAVGLGAKTRTRVRIAECLLGGVPAIAAPIDRLRTLVTEPVAVADALRPDALARLTSTYADEGARMILAEAQRSRARETLSVDRIGPRIARLLKGTLDE